MNKVAQHDDQRTITIVVGREEGHVLLPKEVERAIFQVARAYDEPAVGGNGTDGEGMWWRWSASARHVETIDLRIEGAADIAAASEALGKVEKHVRQALCEILTRLGGDGDTSFINSDSPAKLNEAIYQHVRELEERVMISTAEFTYECDALCPDHGSAGGARCHVRGPHENHEATRKFTCGWPNHLTQSRAKK